MGSTADDAAGNSKDHGSTSDDAAGTSKEFWSLETALAGIPKPVTNPSSSPLAFLHIIERLKTTPREGWRRHGLSHCESIADHMYRMSIISMLCPDSSINRDHCVKMAIVHDMAESLVGDITPLDNVHKDEKHSRELKTMEYLTTELLAPTNPQIAAEILSLWQEYEDGATPEAIFVKDVDKFELLCQSIEYEKRYGAKKDFSEFLQVVNRIKTDYVKKWAQDLMKERKQFWETHATGK
ncbi:hypothetical protein BDZ91DRAFT_688324 [Kalaharituber pfeilii]|nr:hypothetical protein BDZ91DRAFT_688324 [Kalaharituber pfeilii]